MATTRLLLRAAPLLCAATLALAAAACTGAAGGTAQGAGTTAGATPTTSAGPAAGAPAGGAAAATTATASASPAAGYQARVLAWGREFSRCARAHGLPTFPDPTFYSAPDGTGDADFPGIPKEDIVRAQEVCASVLAQHPQLPPPARPPAAATLRHMRQFAQCMREHGVDGFPDPRANGTFPILGTRFSGLAPYSDDPLPAGVQDALDACWQHMVAWRIQAS
jgi:hypothetical protein